MDVSIRRLAVRQLQCCNAERPDVCLAIVARLFDNLWCHPEWCSNECVLLRHGRRKLAGNTEIGELDLSICADQDIGRCVDVSDLSKLGIRETNP